MKTRKPFRAPVIKGLGIMGLSLAACSGTGQKSRPNIILILTYPMQMIRDHDDWSKMDLHKVLLDPGLSSQYIYVIADWGLYYYQGLYGNHDQSCYQGDYYHRH